MATREERITEILNSLKNIKSMSVSEARPVLERAIQDAADELVEEVKETGAGVEEVLSQWKKAFSGKTFWSKVGKQAASDLKPYLETAFLRELPDERQRELLTETFEQGIRYHEQVDYLSGQLGITEVQLKVILKLYNTLIHWVLIDRVARRVFFLRCSDYFGFSEALMGFLWEQLEDKRPMLVERFLVKSVSEHQDTLKRLVGVLAEAFSKGGGEEEES